MLSWMMSESSVVVEFLLQKAMLHWCVAVVWWIAPSNLGFKKKSNIIVCAGRVQRDDSPLLLQL